MQNSIFPTIETERLLLRQFNEKDQENVFNGLSHPDVIKYYGVSFHTFEATKEQMDWFANHEKNGTGLWWAVCSKDNKDFYGAGGYNDLSSEHKKAEIGFWLLPDYWGKGFMKEAMTKMLDHAFAKEGLGLHRIEGFVESTNLKCKQAISKLNFELEGTMKDCEIKDGAFISVDIFAKLNPNNS